MRKHPFFPASLTVAALVAAGLTLTACDNPQPQPSYEDTYVEDVAPQEAVPAEEQAAPAVAEAPVVDTVPVETVPPDVRSSEESVQPDSETLFY
ncbi:hypothetical protein [Brevundimonas sp.]|uniref:hypothetical protein n=1 Tax=Brevundimonas sp. TaxID=1871086 RepID=UPI00289A0136|nr:hypothetical protein [Brevundimonas sp.]